MLAIDGSNERQIIRKDLKVFKVHGDCMVETRSTCEAFCHEGRAYEALGFPALVGCFERESVKIQPNPACRDSFLYETLVLHLVMVVGKGLSD